VKLKGKKELTSSKNNKAHQFSPYANNFHLYYI